MASGRMLKKEISDSVKLGAVRTDKARVLYFMMLPHLDVMGRLEADTRRIKGQITTMLPYSEKVIQGCLDQLNDAELLVLYSISKKQYLEYTRFGDFQRINPDREAKSTIPSPTQEDSGVVQITPSKLSEVKLSLSKDNISQASEEFRLASLLFELMTARKSDFRKPNLTVWAKEVELMIRLDKRDPKKIEAVIRWCQLDSFWQNNILSTKKLRKHFDRLEMQSSNGSSQNKIKLFPISGKTCSKQECKMPAVFKDSSGNYDHYYCGDHMPVEVKEKYTW